LKSQFETLLGFFMELQALRPPEAISREEAAKIVSGFLTEYDFGLRSTPEVHLQVTALRDSLVGLPVVPIKSALSSSLGGSSTIAIPAAPVTPAPSNSEKKKDKKEKKRREESETPAVVAAPAASASKKKSKKTKET